MADLPTASVTVDDEAGAFGGGVDLVIVIAAVSKNADVTPRVFGSTKALLAQHDYSQGADYVAHHIDGTRKQVIFVGLPIATDGAVGRQDDSHVTGTCDITVSPGSGGILEETDAIVEVLVGGTVGTDALTVSLSLDGGETVKKVRLGTATSYTVPYVGIVLNFGAGTLVAGDAFTFTTSAPLWDADGIAAAKTALAAQMKLGRSFVVIGDLPNDTFAQAIVDAADSYETSNQRFVFARGGVRDRLPQAAKSKLSWVMKGNPNLTFAASGHTITRSAGSFISDGFAVGDEVTIAGSASNNGSHVIASLSATVMTFASGLTDEGPVAAVSITGTEALVFDATGHTITRSRGSWLDDGFRVGDSATIAGTASNNVTKTITVLTATVMTFASGLVNETIGSASVTVTTGETMAAWVSAMDSGFSSIDDEKRIDLALGRLRKTSIITGWRLRRSTMWAASVREYQKEIQVPTWRKDDGPLSGWSMEDAEGNVSEFDERNDGGGLAARFTCARTWGNGPRGAFIALSLTRAPDESLLSRTHNMAVTNVACSVVQAESENAVGQVLVLQGDGTATSDSLAKIELRVNKQLALNLLQDFGGEGPRASSAVWSASKSDILNVPGAELTGTLKLELDGTIEKIATRVVVQTAGG